ncbi:MAG: ABC transporter ATP-binding protein/permease [Oscillospiraceae bacterium]|nr:ABC transporter ATP-binding protein/permease [Oscillospiraceae bacterium]
MAYLKKYWVKYRLMFFTSVICVSFEAVCDLLQPRFMAGLIDNGAVKGDLRYVINTGLIMLGIAGAGALFAMVRNISASVASQGFGADLRYDMFSKIQSLSVEETDRFEGGSLVTRMTNDITQMQNFTNGMMRIFFKAPIMCAGAIIMAASLNIRTVFIIAPVIVTVGFIIAAGMKLTFPRFKKVQEALDKLNTTIREYLAGIRLVKAFRRFGEEEKRFDKSNGALADNTVKAVRILAVFSPAASLCVNLGVAAVIFFGSGWVNTGSMRVGEIMAFITYMTQIMNSLGMIAMVLGMFVRVKTSNERIMEVFEAGRNETTPSGGQAACHPSTEGNFPSTPAFSYSFPSVEGCRPQTAGWSSSSLYTPFGISGRGDVPHIVFDGVSFGYRNSTGQDALSNINFTVNTGETLGVIGPTGSGKSTLAALLMRFYDVPESNGEIRISDTPANNIPEEVLRSKIAIVPQTASLFTGTIRENILWGLRENASEDNPDEQTEQIEQAAKIAEAHDFIVASPDGYETIIGQHGVNLSGGQKQRLSIARAVISKPEILILDDCTSALDVMTEARVRRSIKQASEGDMTRVLITQRISAVMTCDKILVLDDGVQAGFGTHSELIDGCGVYKDIYMSQIGHGHTEAKGLNSR